MVNKTINRQDLISLLEAAGDTFFGVTFVKKDGSLRDMTCRFSVTKGVKGDDASDQAKRAYETWKVNNPHLLRLYDTQADGFRTVNLETVRSVRLKGDVYDVM